MLSRIIRLNHVFRIFLPYHVPFKAAWRSLLWRNQWDCMPGVIITFTCLSGLNRHGPLTRRRHCNFFQQLLLLQKTTSRNDLQGLQVILPHRFQVLAMQSKDSREGHHLWVIDSDHTDWCLRPSIIKHLLGLPFKIIKQVYNKPLHGGKVLQRLHAQIFKELAELVVMLKLHLFQPGCQVTAHHSNHFRLRFWFKDCPKERIERITVHMLKMTISGNFAVVFLVRVIFNYCLYVQYRAKSHTTFKLAIAGSSVTWQNSKANGENRITFQAANDPWSFRFKEKCHRAHRREAVWTCLWLPPPQPMWGLLTHWSSWSMLQRKSPEIPFCRAIVYHKLP